MLKRLSVNNYALIDELVLEPSAGFNVITGETGAGKSILLGAIGLIAGQRADTSVLLNKDRKCVVEADFETDESALADFFERENIDFYTPCTIRRELNPQGKSRCFINDTPVTLSVLKDLTGQLIRIHSQHQTLELLQAETRLHYLDSFAGTQKEATLYAEVYSELQRLRTALKSAEEQLRDAERERDFIRFQLNELDAFKPALGEYDQLMGSLDLLNSSGKTRDGLLALVSSISDADVPADRLLSDARHLIVHFPALGGEYASMYERLNNALIELRELSRDATRMLDSAETNPAELERINERVSGYQLLVKKHRLAHADELVALLEKLQSNEADNESLGRSIETMRTKESALLADLITRGKKLTVQRSRATAPFCEAVKELLTSMSLLNARFEISISGQDEPGPEGFDSVAFLFSANKGLPVQPIEKVVSGGELSRLVLAVKHVVATRLKMPTMLFDEIDTGISGKVAAQMASVIRNLAQSMQVIVITHLPQMAARGDRHFMVEKTENDNQTNTRLRVLNTEERMHAVAALLSDEEPGETALRHARELMN